MSVQQPRTKIAEVPVANEKLYVEVARLTRQDKRDVESIVEFVGEFVAKVMKQGNMQAVMLPYFGKFRPKADRIRAVYMYKQRKANGTQAIYEAITGRQKIQNTNHETIRIGGGPFSDAEQGLDSDDPGVQGADV